MVHLGDDRDGDYAGRGSITEQETRNRALISQFALGMTVEQARHQLGEPDFSEAWMLEGAEVRVLRYRTHRTRADGDTTVDETTPLVFRAGRLIGIGEHAVAHPVSGSTDSGEVTSTSDVWRYL